MPKIRLPCGEHIPVLGHGTWHLGQDPRYRAQELDALRVGLDLGMTVIDTAAYGSGASEVLVGAAIADRRDEVFLVDKVLPSHASMRGTMFACEQSLARLGTDRIDLYLLHWRGPFPLADTIEGFERLIEAGKIRMWGVSNFDVEDLEELSSVRGGRACQTDQVLYNLTRRGIEWDLHPWCRERRMPIMAYSPIEHGRLVEDLALLEIARRHRATPAQVAIAWVLRQHDMIAIPKAATPDHVRENHGALAITLSRLDVEELDAVFPPPADKVPLEVY
ncbi:MAG: aldo/keto reductase [Deltaproteobacteria bacterium]|nr:aldo/keto reductase [Deltaproteobacteria bacterium]